MSNKFASDNALCNHGTRFVLLVIVAVCMFIDSPAHGSNRPLPFVKQWRQGDGTLFVATVAITTSGGELGNELAVLKELLQERHISVADDGTPLTLALAAVDVPVDQSSYRRQIVDQAYRVSVTKSGAVLQARTPVGILYSIQTLLQLTDDRRTLPCVEILDWPDLAIRSVMVDPARANENMDYYMRMVRFCARYKINRIHVHLTDDENACLYHEEYQSLMHPHAWRSAQGKSLVAFAKRLHIDLVPEIESLGHARLFLRNPEFREILHKTTAKIPKRSWAGTNVPGFTNVLCPASAKTYEYLEKMYDRAADVFPYPETHIGCDEVDMTTCGRCQERFPGVSQPDWFVQHLLRCHELVTKGGRRAALWGDVLLHHRHIVSRIPTESTVIYDWHYDPKMSDESARFFKEHGFDVIGCPALVCHPHMIMPSDYNYENIRRFAQIAREQDLLGLNTTIWTPTRYMSDVLWTGIAYAAVHAWSGSNWDEPTFYRSFAKDFFDTAEGDAFATAWTDLYHIRWWLKEFRISCWADEESVLAAQEEASGKMGAEARGHLKDLQRIRKELAVVGKGVRRNRDAWDAIEKSAAIRAYVMEHLLACTNVRRDGEWNEHLLRDLDHGCLEALHWIEADWDRNRFAGDPYKEDLNETNQHLLHRFHAMHEFHQRMIGELAGRTVP